MTIEIRTPELERLVREEMQGGTFQSVDDVLAEALQALREKRAQAPAGNGQGREADARPGKGLKLPARPLGQIGALHRRDIYDDAR
jgi:Arc/MetJ-type ribon-helix-helix transcriptional regulator